MNQDAQYEIQEITIKIETPDGELPPAKVRIPNVPTRLSSLIPPMQQLCNGIVGLTIRREQALGSSITCRAGCGTCCRQIVPLSAPEAFFLWDYLNSLPSERQDQIRSRFAMIREAMEASGLTSKLSDLESVKNQEIAWEYFQLGVPCPFLEEESCRIHLYRPFACREYNVISTADLCADPFNNPIQKLRIPKNMTTATAMLAAKLFEVPPMLIPMSLFLDWVAENEPLKHRTWPGVWLFNLMLDYAT